VGFTAAQAARLTGCTPSQLSSWERSGLVAPPPGPAHYRLQDLVALRVVASLLDAGLSLDLIRGAVGELVQGGDDAPPRSLVTDGGMVWACRDDGQVLDALRHGPVACVIAVDRIRHDVDAAVRAFDAERRSFVQGLHDAAVDADDDGAPSPPSGEQATAGGEAESGRAGDASARVRSRRHAAQR
jgi:DNA-binding transcriptional MerR regulator